MGKQVGVLRAEAGEHGLVSVGPAVAIGVAVETDVGTVLNEGSVPKRQHAKRHHEAVGEHARFCPARRGGVRIIEHHDAIAAPTGEQRVGGGFVLVSVHRIFERGHRPESQVRVPGQGDEFPQAFGFRGHQFHLETGGQREAPPLRFRSAGPVGDGVVAYIPAGRPRLGGAGSIGRIQRPGGAHEDSDD